MEKFSITIETENQHHFMMRDNPKEIAELWSSYLEKYPQCKVKAGISNDIYWTSLELFKGYYKSQLSPQKLPSEVISSATIIWSYEDIPLDGQKRTIACYNKDTNISYIKEIICNYDNIVKETFAYAWTDFIFCPPPAPNKELNGV